MKSFLALVALVSASSMVNAADAPSAAAPAPASAPAIGMPAAPAPTPPPAPERIEAAKVLMTNMHFAETLGKALTAQSDNMSSRIDQSLMYSPSNATAEEKAAYKKEMIALYNSVVSVQTCLDGMTNVYASLFTVDELKGMADFYSSPAGQALVAKTAELQKKSGEVLQKQMMLVGPKLQARQQAFTAAHPAPAAPTPAAAGANPMMPKNVTPGAPSAAAAPAPSTK